jgi:F-type H+-transporting ATPase subunit a
MSAAALSGQQVLATGDIQPGHHPTLQFVGLTFNTDTLISTGVAGVIVLGAGL